MNILNWFRKEKKNVAEEMRKFEERFPVGSWYRGGNGIVRLSNVYVKKDEVFITIERPTATTSPIATSFCIVKEDDLSPSYLNGWNRVEEKEAVKLENSYWKTIEKDLSKRTEEMKKFYNAFIKEGNK